MKRIWTETKAVVTFVGGYIVYFAKYFYWATKRFVESRPISAMVVGVLLFVLFGWTMFGNQIITYLRTPKPPPFTAAPKTSGFQFQAQDNRFNVTAFVGDTKNNPVVETKFAGGSTVSFGLTDTNQNISKPSQSGNIITFSNVRNNIDLKYQTLVGGIKESMIIKTPTPGNAFTFAINAQNASPKPIGTNIYSSTFYDTNGKYLFGFVKPFAIDAKNNRTDNVVLTIQRNPDGNSYVARVIINQKWLADPARAYPITVDPTITYNTTSQFSYGQYNRIDDTQPGTYSPIVSDANTVALWHMDEASGNVLDSSGNNNTGTVTGTSVVAGQSGLGNARSFNGSSDTISIANQSNFSFDRTNAFSIEAWIKTSATGVQQNIFTKMSNSAPYTGYDFYIDTTNVLSFILVNTWPSNAIAVSTTATVTDGKWHRVAVTYNGASSASGVNIYIDGVNQNLTIPLNSLSASITNSLNPYIGSRNNTAYYFNGTIDDLRISNVALNPTVIANDATLSPNLTTYYQELPADEYTMGLFHLNETSPGNANAIDSSGNNSPVPASAGVTITNGVVGNARSFNGSSYISNGTINMPTGSVMTAEAWIYPTSYAVATYNGIVSWGTRTGANAFLLAIQNTGILSFATWGNDFVPSSGPAATLNQWNHVAAVLNGTSVQLYLNGQLAASGTLASTPNVTSTNFAIGMTDFPGRYFNGNIDEVRISNVARSAEEIRMDAQIRPYGVYTSDVLSAAMIAGTNQLAWTELGVGTGDGETLSSATNLVAQWNFNSTSGTTATADAGSCGSTCNLTLNNFASTGSQDAAAGTGWTAANARWPASSPAGLMFDGVNDYASCTDANCGGTGKLDFGTGSFSLESWFKTSSSSQIQMIMAKRDSAGTNNAGFVFFVSTDKTLNCRAGDGTNSAIATSKAGYSDGSWHLATCVINRGNQTINLYADGLLLASASTSSVGSVDNAIEFDMGEFGSAGTYIYPFNGVIDSSRAYSRALTATEILSNYNAGNVELQTRVGNTTDPNDGSWDAWAPVTSETAIDAMNSGNSGNWTWDNTPAGMPKSAISDDSNIKVEGTGSMKLSTGQFIGTEANTLGLWHLDETGGSGAYLTDSSGNGHGGTPTGTTVVNGVAGEARKFSSASDYVTLTGEGSAFSINSYSVEAWVQETAAQNPTSIIFDNRSSVSAGWMLYTAGAGPFICLYNAYTVSGTTTPSIGSWYHVACTSDGATLKIYVNGSLENSTAISGSITETTDAVIGGRSFSTHANNFTGNIDEVRVSNVTRTQTEIAEAYRMGANHFLNRTISATDLSSVQKLAFDVAADRPGTYLSATIGNNAYDNYQPDANTVGLWHLENNASGFPPSTTGLLGLWHLDDTTGTGAYILDSSGGGHNGWTGIATGGTITNSAGYTIHSFVYPGGTYTSYGSGNASVLVVAGGGGSGSNGGGGGGAGGLLYNASYAISSGGYTVTVGAGGGASANGNNSIFGTMTATGGGAGGSRDSDYNGHNGGSGGGGGGAFSATTGGSGTAGQGNNGGADYAGAGVAGPGGGGGCGAVGSNGAYSQGGNGGIGCANSITGSSVYYAGGGGGGLVGGFSGTPGTGGTGGGGSGVSPGGAGNNGTANTGGGAGGNSASGGSGIVIVRDPLMGSGTTSVAGKIGNARSFNGVSDYISIPNSSSLDFGSGNFSMEWWEYRTDSGATRTTMQRDYSQDGVGYSPWLAGYSNGTNLYFYATSCGTGTCGWDIANAKSLGPITLNQWVHLAVVRNGTTFYTYKNGVQQDTWTSALAIQNGTGPLEIGKYWSGGPGNYSFTGNIDEVRFYNQALSALQIAADAGIASIPIITDSSGNGNTGSAVGTSFIQGQIGKARSFNGSSDYIYTAPLTGFTGGSQISWEAWFNPSAVDSTQNIILDVLNEIRLEVSPTNQIRASVGNGTGWCTGLVNISGGPTLSAGQWYHAVTTYDGSTLKLYLNGQLIATGSGSCVTALDKALYIGEFTSGGAYYFPGIIDEVRISKTARSAADIRAAYEVGRRTHQITIDFAAKLGAGDLITGSGDLSFKVLGTVYGLSQNASNLYLGDKIIVRENYNGTTYIAQGTVNSVDPPSGQVTVASWDSGSTFPAGGFTANADVFKWQREYFDLSGIPKAQKNGVTTLSLRETNGNEGRNIWLDDLRSVGNYLTNPAGDNITSTTGKQYLQYRAIFSSSDYDVSPSVTSTSVNIASNAPNAPVMLSPTITDVTGTTIQWNFTNPGGTITGFKIYGPNNGVKVICSGAALTSCTETGLTPNTSYSRKVTAYNASGDSPFSLPVTGITLAAVPPAPSATAVSSSSLQLTVSAGTNPSTTEYALYQITGVGTCGSGGQYIQDTSGTLGASAAWKTPGTWSTITISGLNLDANQYTFCAKAHNNTSASPTDTAWAINTNDGGYLSNPPNGIFTWNGNGTFGSVGPLVDGSNSNRKVAGIDMGPAGWWRLDESSGAASDSSGNGFTLSNNAVTYAAGKYNNAGVFNGSADFWCTNANCGGTTKLDSGIPSSNKFSFSAWAKRNGNPSSAYEQILTKKAGSLNLAGYAITMNIGGNLQCKIADGTNNATITTGSTVWGDNNWHYVVCVNDGTNLTIYVDGNSYGSAGVSGVTGTLNNSANFVVGANNDATNGFNGSIDEVRVYHTALNQFQIKQDMNTNNPQNVSTFIMQGGALTIQQGQTLVTGQLTFPNGSTASLALPGPVKTLTANQIGQIKPSPMWYGLHDADGDTYTSGDPTTYYFGTSPPTSGRRRWIGSYAGMGTDCNDSLFGYQNTLASTYYPDSDNDTYTVSPVSAGSAVCSSSSNWTTTSSVSAPGSSSSTSFAAGTRRDAASSPTDCDDTIASIGTGHVFGVVCTPSGIGSGNDGNITISASKNINANPIASGRTIADGEAFAVSALTTNTVTVTGTGTGGTAAASVGSSIAAGDEIMLIDTQGTPTYYSNVGNYENLYVRSVSGAVITTEGTFAKNYGDTGFSDGVGTDQKVMVQRVPNYGTVAVNATFTLSPSGWDGAKGGMVAFRATGSVSVSGAINSSNAGYRGDALSGSSWGESFCKPTTNGQCSGGAGCGQSGGAQAGSSAGGSGGPGQYNNNLGRWSSGGGGGYASGGQAGAGDGTGTTGTDGTTGSNLFLNTSGGGGGCNSGAMGGGGGGGSYGIANLSRLFFGSTSGKDGNGTNSNRAGGIIFINVNTLTVNSGGTIAADGGPPGGQEGHAAGSIYIWGNSESIGTALIHALRYDSNTTYGLGRVAIHGSVTGTSSPAFTSF